VPPRTREQLQEVRDLTDKSGFDAVVGGDEEAAVLLPVVIGELASMLERLVGPADPREHVP
jgi:hypothetical protein